MSRIQAPLTLPKHPELLKKLNDASIAIKLHHIVVAETNDQPAKVIEARRQHPCPTWPKLVELLDQCRQAINEQREDPRKY